VRFLDAVFFENEHKESFSGSLYGYYISTPYNYDNLLFGVAVEDFGRSTKREMMIFAAAVHDVNPGLKTKFAC